MKLVLVNLYPLNTIAEYMLSSYVLKAYLDKYGNGIDTEVLDFSIESDTEKIFNSIVEENPDFVGYSCYIWNIDMVKNLAGRLKGKYIQIMGGPEITSKNIKPDLNADHFIVGEGEKQLLALVKSLQGQESTESSTGNITDLNVIPSPYLDGAIPEQLYKRKMVLLETQRGCKYRCKFCVYHKNLPSIRYYSQERVERELHYLIKNKGVYALRIFDATFTSDLSRAKKIVNFLIELKKETRLPWIYWEWRWEDVDEEFIQLLGKLKYKDRICNSNNLTPLDRSQHYSEMLEGYTCINSVGIESFNPESMKAVSRSPIDLKKYNQFMIWVKKYNIALKMDLIMDLPCETYNSFWKGIEYLLPYLENTDHILNVHLLEILPGSKLEEDAPKYSIIYGKEAPHLVTETKGFGKSELNFSSILIALLLRFINSPLRREFIKDFKSNKEKNLTLESFIKTLYVKGIRQNLPGIKVSVSDFVDEDYWENQIFEDIPSEWLKGFYRY